jgi:hypothetical protein
MPESYREDPEGMSIEDQRRIERLRNVVEAFPCSAGRDPDPGDAE